LLTDKLNKSEIRVLQLSEKTGLSYFIVRNIIKSFYIAGICKKGRREGNGETYYLCKGVEIINEKT